MGHHRQELGFREVGGISFHRHGFQLLRRLFEEHRQSLLARDGAGALGFCRNHDGAGKVLGVRRAFAQADGYDGGVDDAAALLVQHDGRIAAHPRGLRHDGAIGGHVGNGLLREEADAVLAYDEEKRLWTEGAHGLRVKPRLFQKSARVAVR